MPYFQTIIGQEKGYCTHLRAEKEWGDLLGSGKTNKNILLIRSTPITN